MAGQAPAMLITVALNAFALQEKPYKRADGGGLFILVQPNGAKIWRMAYRIEWQAEAAVRWSLS